MSDWVWFGIGIFLVVCLAHLYLLIRGKIRPENTVFFGIPLMVVQVVVNIITRILFLALFAYLVVGILFFVWIHQQCQNPGYDSTAVDQSDFRGRLIDALTWPQWLMVGEPTCGGIDLTP